ncbi:MAG: CinA family protein [Lachnospiraceae bacterium]|nr:CinA family protein [Lachnospiraceae bacterium]MDY4970061.1 CinA family protein [Lachnospiraceae bacterium]
MANMDYAKIREQYRELTELLIEKKLTITTMESATAGLIASLITDTEGSSAVLKGAFVTYCNEAKIMQGVPAEIIDTFGVYSPDTARAMAKACRAAYRADIGVGITGSFGNVDPNNADSVPGVLYYTIDFRGRLNTFRLDLDPLPTRLDYKMKAAGEVVDTLLLML